MQKKTDNVNHPAHYAEAPFVYRKPECIDITQYLPFSTGNAVKYIWRSALKSTDYNEDLDKARWYLHAYSFDAGQYQGFAHHLVGLLVPADAKDEVASLKLDIIGCICAGGRPLEKIEQLRSMLTERSKDGKKASAKRKR